MCKLTWSSCIFHAILSTPLFKAGIEDDTDGDKFKKILEQLDKMNKREARNAANIKAIARKLTEEERAENFSFPLRSEDLNEKLEECLLSERFRVKLVNIY